MKRTIIIASISVAVLAAAAIAIQGTALSSQNSNYEQFQFKHTLGEANAPLTMIEWGDYQCTYCYRFHEETRDEVMSKFVSTGLVKFTFMDFPLNGEASVLAAEASHCAGEQNKYWEYHDELYNNWAGENTGWVNMDNLRKFAMNIELDTDAFNTCLESGKYRQIVIDEHKRGQRIGINATPMFLIIGKDGDIKTIRGAQPYSVFDRVISDMLHQNNEYGSE